ncbi:MAG: undecaprenyl/decaprenyl-phosphate alpha-N-acetylglucosaminyl 1-phosphate transferase [Candidatus Babeliaceae bacterium]|nr:undecaprenyl/decaprenyl-phosphate alpha-N-acetylglucosaminyl 1-phosphate transferase [Candidatus Babeliaceae bacterium]
MIGLFPFVVLIAACIFAILTSFLITPLFIKIAFARDILDRPTGLKNHKTPVPYLGGLAVYSSFIIALALFFPVDQNLSFFLIGSTLLLLIGLVDDLMPLSAFYKLLGQIMAALCFLKGGFFLKQEFIGSFSSPLFPYLFMAISFFWVLTIVNAINLVDIMDGLASTSALGVFIGFFVFACIFNRYCVALIISICIGTLVGFLHFNKAPAKIYLGDAGSLFIGGILATIPFMLPWGTYTAFGFLTPVIILGVPLVEVLSLVIIRTCKGTPFYLGSPDHFAHYYLAQSWSKKSILVIVTAFNIILIIVSLLFNLGYLSILSTIITLFLLLVAWCATLYGKYMLFFINKK